MKGGKDEEKEGGTGETRDRETEEDSYHFMLFVTYTLLG